MFIVKYYLFIAVMCAVGAFYSPFWYFSIILAWISLSLSAVSFAYLSDSPWIFRKSASGSIPFYVQWIFIPFLLGAQLYNSWQRRTDSVPAIQKVHDNLFLACRLFPSDVAELKQNDISAILDATAEFSGMNWSADDENLDYLNVPILDHQAPHKDDVIKAIHWIGNHIHNGESVVVHCALGRGRSVLIVAAYLLAAQKAESVDDAMQQINSIRGTARLNSYQTKKLERMHKEGVLSLKQRALLVVNPASGNAAWEESQEYIKQTIGQRYQLSFAFTEKDKPMSDLLSEESLGKYSTVLACGGDGTVNAVAQVIQGKALRFGIIPLGTTNALSHVLYGSKVKTSPVETACDIILANNTATIDAAKCNEHIMILAAGIGFEEKMIAGADREKKDQLGQLAYISALFDALRENASKEYQISIDGEKAQKVMASSILVANASPVTTMLAQGKGQPDPTDGKLDVTILNTSESSSEPFGKLAAQALTKGGFEMEANEDFQHHFVKQIQIDSNEAIHFAVDGELDKASQLVIKVIPRAFEIFTSSEIEFAQHK